MIHVLASIRIKEGRRAEFIGIFKANVPEVLKEKGCLGYVPTVDFPTGKPTQALDGNVVTIVEKWASPEALQNHLVAPHMSAYREKVRNMVEGESLRILQDA
ncbi:MAG: antibiotic biosynthesis monooxygenase [Candidatus Accumulibacter sp.]|jgi:quinol monooxygenase YgiN|nr:antibiotic biosynthesis monooxygenase [Accumulibacter sp.]